MKPTESIGILALSLAIGAPLFAHDTWIAPQRASVSPGSVLALDMTSGMAFPVLDHAIEPDRIASASCRLGGKRLELDRVKKAPNSLQLTAPLDAAGVATLWVSLKPRAIELKPEEVEHYLDEVNAPDSVRKAWTGAGDRRRWREIYTKHSKTHVRVGEPSEDRSWSEPVGMALELLPEKDPTTLRRGDELPVRVLKRGEALPGISVGIVSEGGRPPVHRATDRDGRIFVHLDRAGLWLLRGTEIRQSSAAGAEWESDFSTLTIDVRP